MRRLVFLTQSVDPAHPVLAATIPKIRALAARVDEVVVLAQSGGGEGLPSNVDVRTFGAATQPGRAWRFERELARALPADAVVAHMIPVYVLLAAPLVRPRRIPLVLWYTHWKASPTLRVAERLATAIVSVDRRSFPLESAKVRGIGHGIDVNEFACTDRGAHAALRALVLGRYSPAKGIETILRGVQQVDGVEVEAARRGAERPGAPAPWGARGLGFPWVMRYRVSDVPDLFAAADVLINNMEAGAPDKVVYEAAAACLPVLASNPVFDELFDGFPLSFDRESPESLAERLRWLASLDEGERAKIGRTLRERVAERHSVDTWADGVLGGGAMNGNGLVLHLQKVAGISGSEAHLLSLLPRLKERGWDVRFLMLHEHEPGAWDFARELTDRGIPLDAISLAADVDPIAFLRLGAYLARKRPRILHTHLVHADVYGQLTGALTGIPVRVSTKHGFNEFRENPGFALGDRAIATFAHTHIAISRGLARYLEEVEGFDGASFEIVHYGIEPDGEPRPYEGSVPRLLVCRAPDSHQGSHRAAARVRGGAAPDSGPRAADRRPRSAGAGAAGAREGARDRGCGSLPRLCRAGAEGDCGRRGRGRAVHG